MSEARLKEANEAMDRAVDAIAREFSMVRTGKASPALLDTIRVEAYGAVVPLKQVANVSTPDPTLIVVQPYDPNVAGAIANAIRDSDLGLNPIPDAAVVRVPIPPLTEERRKEMVKVLHRMAEEGKVSIRHARQEARGDLLDAQREGELGEDDCHRLLDRLQELTDSHTRRVDEMLSAKEEEVMSV